MAFLFVVDCFVNELVIDSNPKYNCNKPKQIMDIITNFVKSQFKRNITYKGFINAIRLNDIDTVREYLIQDNPEKIAAKINATKDYPNSICIAAEEGNVEIAELLLKAGANPNIFSIESPLVKSIRKNNNAMFELLVNNGANVEESNPPEIAIPLDTAISYRRTHMFRIMLAKIPESPQKNNLMQKLLLKAIEHESIEIIELLLEAGVRPDILDNQCNLPLLKAASTNNPAMLQLLIDKVVSLPNANNVSLNTALRGAIKTGYKDNVQILLNAGADPSVQNEDGDTALLTAIKEGKLESTKVIISAIKNGNKHPIQNQIQESKEYDDSRMISAKNILNLKNNEGDTALSLAISYGYEKIFELLFDAGANTDIKYKNGDTLLIKAAKNNLKISRLLIPKINNLDETDNDKNTALNIAASLGNKQCVEMLLKAGANPNIQNNKGNTALLSAIKNHHLDIAEIILSKMMHDDRFKNGINLQTNGGLTALNMAVSFKHNNIIHNLITAGADVNISDARGNTPLINAIDFNNILAVETLINSKADVNLSNKDKETPIILAVKLRAFDIIKFLVLARADVNMQDKNGNTAFNIAIMNNLFEIANYLLDNNANPNIFNSPKNNPLIFLIDKFTPKVGDNFEIIKILGNYHLLSFTLIEKVINSGIDINTPDEDGNTPLILLVALHTYLENKIKMDNRILFSSYGYNPNTGEISVSRDLYQKRVVEFGDKLFKLIKLLLESGCDTSIRNHKGETAELINKSPIIASMLDDNTSSIAAQHENLIRKAKSRLNSINGKKTSKELKIQDNQKVIDDLMDGTLQSIRLVKDNLLNIDNINKFASVANEISDLIAILGLHLDDDKRIIFDKAAHSTRKVAAVIGDDNAKRIVKNFANDDDEAPKNVMLFSPKSLAAKNDECYEEHKSSFSPKPIGEYFPNFV